MFDHEVRCALPTRAIILAIAALGLSAVGAHAQPVTDTPTPTNTPTVTSTRTNTNTRTPTVTPTPTLWTVSGNLSFTRVHHTSTLLLNGKLLAVGGYSPDYTKTAELFDPPTGTWSTTGTLATGRYQQTATLLRNGQVLVV